MTVVVLLTSLLSLINATQATAPPPQSDAQRQLDQRGAHAMGFDQEKTKPSRRSTRS